MKTKPFAPGSDDAIKAGCICPVVSNNHGRGAYEDSNGNPISWYNKECQIHGQAHDIDPKEILTKLN